MFISIITIHKRQFAVLRKMMLRSKFIRWIVFVFSFAVCFFILLVFFCFAFIEFTLDRYYVLQLVDGQSQDAGRYLSIAFKQILNPIYCLYNECVKSTEHLCCKGNVWRFEANAKNLDKYSENEKAVEESDKRKREKNEQ